jgi:hypothetical protein
MHMLPPGELDRSSLRVPLNPLSIGAAMRARILGLQFGSIPTRTATLAGGSRSRAVKAAIVLQTNQRAFEWQGRALAPQLVLQPHL